MQILDQRCAHTLPFICTYLFVTVLLTFHSSMSSLLDEVYLLLPMKYIFSGQVSISSMKNVFFEPLAVKFFKKIRSRLSISDEAILAEHPDKEEYLLPDINIAEAPQWDNSTNFSQVTIPTQTN